MDFQARLTHVATRFNEVNGELVSIDRPNATAPTANITASPIINKPDEFYPGVSQTRIELQDWCIDVVDYEIDGVPTKPTAGDTIIRASGETFRVIGMGESEPCYSYTTSTRNRYKIHSERITESALTETDNTAAIQALLNAGGAVVIPTGTWVVGPLTFPASVTSVTGEDSNSVLKLKAFAGDGARILYVRHQVNGNRSVTISGLKFDMNRYYQGDYLNYEVAHQAAIFLTAEDSTGTLFVTIDNVEVYDSAGDGIYVHHRVDAEISDYSANTVFRSSMAQTGHNSFLTLTNATLQPSASLNIEPNDDAHVLTTVVDGLLCTHFTAILNPGCSFTGNDIHATGDLYIYCPPGCDFHCSDSTYSNRFNFRLPHATFENCTFNAPIGNPSNIIRMSWSHNGYTSGMVCTLIDCLIDGPAILGIETGVDPNNNTITLTNVAINNTTNAIDDQGSRGTWNFTNVTDDGTPITP